MRKLSLAALGVAALAALLWWQRPAAAPPDRPEEPSGSTPAANDAATAGRAGDADSTAGSDRAAREALPTAAAPATGWTIQLVGIDPEVPWTAPFGLSFEQRTPVQVAIDAAGEGRFEPPAYARSPAFQNLRLVAKDDHYILERAHHRTDSLQQTGRATFTVYPIAQLRGRVLGPDGVGIFARVSAFEWSARGPHGTPVASTRSGDFGRYELHAPPGMPLLLQAEALGVVIPNLLWTSYPVAELDYEESPSLDEPPRDARPVRSDLLPATARAQGDHAHPRDVPDLRLGATAALTGRATLADGHPLARVEVVATPTLGDATPWRIDQYWSPSEGLVVGATTTTDAQGRFELRLPPGRPFAIRIRTEDPVLLAGQPTAVASAPEYVELVAPGDLVELQVVADGAPAPKAALEFGATRHSTDAAGRLRVTLGPDTVRARAHADVRSSDWLELPVGARPARATLELAALPLAEVRLRLQSAAILRDVELAFASLTGNPERVLPGHRDLDDLPFVVRVPPDRYRVTVRGAKLAPGAAFLMPLQLDLDVPAAGVTAEATIPFGALLGLDVRRANGVRPGGTFTLRNAAGLDLTPSAQRMDEPGDGVAQPPGVLHPGSINRLRTPVPPGTYALTVDADGSHFESTLTLHAGNWTTVPIRLP